MASYAHEIDVNLKGVLNCTKVVISDMSKRRSGTIINISSVSDRKTCPVAITYTATALSSWRETSRVRACFVLASGPNLR